MTSKMPVSVLKLDEPLATLRRALELCGGLGKLRAGDRVLIKPNLCIADWMPPFGVVTTTTLLEALLQLLAEFGCRNVALGEGPVDVFGLTARKGFRRQGIDRAAKRFGVRLLDLNRGPFRTIDLDGHAAQVAEAALEADFLVNVPVLKTHNQVKVSLGFKNLKGVLAPVSKTRFHGVRRLDHLIKCLSEAVRPHLTLIDGTYALEKGPDTVLGTAHRTNLLVAGTDPFAVDVVGATLLGVDPADVGYLAEFAQDHRLLPTAAAVDLRGETELGPLVRKLAWKAEVVEEVLVPQKVTGLSVPHPGETLCSRCYAALGYSLIALAADHPGSDFGGAALVCGKEAAPAKEAKGAVVLYGDCAARRGAALPGASRIEGCPPTMLDSVFGLSKALVGTPGTLGALPLRLAKLGGAKLGRYGKPLAKWKRYEAPEFDWGHFASSAK